MTPTTKLTAILELQQWNHILALLQDGGVLPYRIVQPLIQTLHEQLNDPNQLAAAPLPSGGNVVPMGEASD